MQLKPLHILLFLLVAGSLQAQVMEKFGGTGSVLKGDLAYYQNELAIHEKSGTKDKVIEDLTNLGAFYMQSHDYTNAIQYFKKLIVLYKEANDHSGMADMMIYIGDAYRALSDFPHLLEYLQEATSEYKKAGNEKGLAKTLRSIGYYYLNLSENRLPAIPFFQQSLVLYKKMGIQKEESFLLIELGHTNLLNRDSVQAIYYLRQAVSLCEKIENKEGLAKCYGIMGDYYFRMPVDIPKALECFKKSITLFEETNNKIGVGQVLINLSDLYVYAPDTALERAGIPLSEKYARAIESVKKGYQIFKELLPESELMWPLGIIWQIYEKMGNSDSAFYYHKLYIATRDRVTNTEKQKDIVRLEEKYEYKKKADSMELQEALTDEKLKRQLLLYKQQQQQLELNQSQLDLANKEKNFQHLAFLKTQSDFENERLVKQQKEKEIQLQSVRVKSLTQQNEIIQLNQQRQWIYVITGFLLLGAASMYFIYRSRLRSVRFEGQLAKEKAEQQQKESEFQHKLADISLSALRSQMNPHFIFNCLNSIKLYTQQNDTESASVYLTKFSKLIRLVLENSRNEKITLADEMAALELYIEMEVMRFKNKLTYSIQIADEVEADYIEIPPLLLQPYVENAIWHGLMHKEEGGHIEITAAMQNEGSLLEIDIIDNGIGRAMAQLKNKKPKNHNSYGMKATSDRIALINQIYKTGANVVINDLADHEGHPSGTQVTIQLPV